MNGLVWLARVLTASVARKGEVPLTNAHLLNIVKLAIRAESQNEAEAERAAAQALTDDKMWGSS